MIGAGAAITPPVGFNLFVVQQMTGDSQARVALAALLFCVLLILVILAVTIWPALVL